MYVQNTENTENTLFSKSLCSWDCDSAPLSTAWITLSPYWSAESQLLLFWSSSLPVCLGKQQQKAQVLGPLPSLWEMRMQLQVPGSGLDQPWPLQLFREWTSEWRILSPLSLSSSLPSFLLPCLSLSPFSFTQPFKQINKFYIFKNPTYGWVDEMENIHKMFLITVNVVEVRKGRSHFYRSNLAV